MLLVNKETDQTNEHVTYMVECSCICSWACSQVFHLLFCCKDVYTLVFEEPMQATLREFRKTLIAKNKKCNII